METTTKPDVELNHVVEALRHQQQKAYDTMRYWEKCENDARESELAATNDAQKQFYSKRLTRAYAHRKQWQREMRRCKSALKKLGVATNESGS
jgi:hypothetical protein